VNSSWEFQWSLKSNGCVINITPRVGLRHFGFVIVTERGYKMYSVLHHVLLYMYIDFLFDSIYSQWPHSMWSRFVHLSGMFQHCLASRRYWSIAAWRITAWHANVGNATLSLYVVAEHKDLFCQQLCSCNVSTVLAVGVQCSRWYHARS